MPGRRLPPKRRRIKTDDLYIMRYSTCSQAVKIGRITDVERRKNDLESGQNFFIDIVAVFPGNGALERIVHSRLEDKRSHIGYGTEWFNITVDEALDSVRQVILEHDHAAVNGSTSTPR